LQNFFLGRTEFSRKNSSVREYSHPEDGASDVNLSSDVGSQRGGQKAMAKKKAKKKR